MGKFSKKYRELLKLLGYIGIGIGFIGMIFISIILLQNLYTLFFQPEAAAGIALVLPGVNIPGVGVLPFWYWLISIFVIAVMHEGAHGVIALAHNVKIKKTGLFLLGPIIGAFVEPNEKEVKKQSDIVQYSILAAGAFSNIIFAFFILILMIFAVSPIHNHMVEPNGISFSGLHNNTVPASLAGLEPGMIITGINNVTTLNYEEFYNVYKYIQPGDLIQIKANNNWYDLKTISNPEDNTATFIGIKDIKQEFILKQKFSTILGNLSFSIVSFFKELFKWLYILSLGIGIFNLLPLGIADGGRMLQVALWQLKKDRKKADILWKKISALFIFVLLLILFILLLRFLGITFI